MTGRGGTLRVHDQAMVGIKIRRSYVEPGDISIER
jgi:hypothetical protein